MEKEERKRGEEGEADKFILVTGGVLSGIGKGVIASSTGVLMKGLGFEVTHIKIDPYLNIDAGTMSPFEHGEVYVLEDGGEVDLDLGNYERFSQVVLTKDHNITTGKIYNEVIQKERRGDYLGKTVQVVPHIVEAIQNWILRVSKIKVDFQNKDKENKDKENKDEENNKKESQERENRREETREETKKRKKVCVIELGGTVGDIESMPFLEAMRQFQFKVGKGNFCLVHVSLVPQLGNEKEPKTKPTQHSVRTLMSLGLVPNVLVCRSRSPLSLQTREKLSSFCHVETENVIGVHDLPNLYHVPLSLHTQNYHSSLLRALSLRPPSPSRGEKVSGEGEVSCFTSYWKRWEKMVQEMELISRLPHDQHNVVRVGIVGKYTDLFDSYHSVTKSLEHASFACGKKLEIVWIVSEHLSPSHPSSQDNATAWKNVECCNGLLVPGGFGERGIEGKVLACKYARENNVPFLGICLGMQVAVVEFARNVLHLPEANSTEFEENTKDPLVIPMPEFSAEMKGGTMRLGSRNTQILPKHSSTLLALLYRTPLVSERHRHRYEVNPSYVERLEEKGMLFVGVDLSNPHLPRNEMMQLSSHPYYVGVQFHPEFKSRPLKPSPPFLGLILASSKQSITQFLQKNPHL